MIRIMLVDDHRIFRQGVASLFHPLDDMEVVAECGEAHAAVGLAGKMNVDVVVMDISLPDSDGIDAACQILSRRSDTRIVLLSMLKDPMLVDKALAAGIHGYVVKDDAFDNLIYAIRAVMRGERYVNFSISPFPEKPVPAKTEFETLTQREKEIVKQICDGFSSREIADNLFISIKTVETHRARILEKLDVRNAAQLVRLAVENHLI